MTTVPAAARRPSSNALRRFLRAPSAWIGLGLMTLLVIGAVFAPQIAPQNPFDLAAIDVLDARMTPGSVSSTGDITYLLGTDGQGRDLFSAILYGLRISLMVGAFSGILAAGVGMAIGLIAAYAGGRTENIIMRIVDLQLSLPSVLVALILVAGLGKGVDKIIIALVMVQWAYYARTVRGSALVERRREYIEAAQCLAFPTTRILFRHLLPNCLPPLIVVGTIQIARAIALEATLSFLGLGVPITEPSLGLLIANGYEYMLSGKYWISFYPGIALLVTIVSINLMGDHLRDVLNPRLKK